MCKDEIEKLKSELRELKDIISKRNKTIKRLQELNEELREENKNLENSNFNLKQGDKLFISYLTYLGDSRSLKGELAQEGAKFLKVKILDSKKNKPYYYIIAKSLIGGIKVYYD